MKRYKLLKDLPFAKAGEIFKSKILDDGEETKLKLIRCFLFFESDNQLKDKYE